MKRFGRHTPSRLAHPRVRRAGIRAVLAGLLLGAVLGLGGCGRPPEASKPPNVLVLVMDTTRADRCSLYGYDRSTTPGLESLARESTVFTDAWSPAPWTGPAHGSLFTGLRPENHGFLKGQRAYLDDTATTLAEVLAQGGYRTACFTNNSMVSPRFGLAQGFQRFQLGGDETRGAPPSARWANRHAVEFALESRRMERPFFVFVNDWEPHLAYDPPEEFAARFVSDDESPQRIEGARTFRATNDVLHGLGWRRFLPDDWGLLSDLYDAEIASLDAEISTMVESLRREGLLDDTILVIAADHGENLGDHGLCSHVYSLHRTLLHVPLLIRFPREFEAGRVVDDVVRLEDLFPTILELCGLPVPEAIDGVSLTGDLSGRIARAALGGMGARELGEIAKANPEFPGTGYGASLRSVYDGRYHLILASDGRRELYDVKADPAESEDLARGDPETLVRLRSLLPQLKAPSPQPMPRDGPIPEQRFGRTPIER